MANIFGDSSDDSDDEPLEKTIRTTTTGEELDKNDGDRKLDKNEFEQDEDKEDEREPHAEMKTSEKDEAVAVKKKKATNESVLDEYAGEDKEEATTEGEKEERKGEPMHLIAALNEEE